MAQYPKYQGWFSRNLQLFLTVSGIFVGIFLGFFLRILELSDYEIYLIGFPGEIFLSMLKMIVVPLIATSLIAGLSQFDGAQSGKVGKYALLFYCITLSLSVLTGIAVVLLIHPGHPMAGPMPAPSVGVDDTVAAAENQSSVDKFLDLIRNMFPDNIFQSTVQHIETKESYSEVHFLLENGTTIMRRHLMVTKEYIQGTNIFGIIVACIVVGVAISRLGEPVKPIRDVVLALEKIVTYIVGLIMWFAPVGIASVITHKVLSLDDLGRTLLILGSFVITVIVGLTIHLFITEPIVYFLAARKNPYAFIKGLSTAIMTGIGTSSSAATLPITLVCLEKNNGVDPRISKLVLPVGTVVNMDGTALYEALVAIFIAQLHGVDLTAAQIFSISLCAVLASIGAAAIPSAGLVTIVMVLSAVNLPTTEISLIFAVDWFLDRYRTVVNLVGDAFGCGFVEALCERNAKANLPNILKPEFVNGMPEKMNGHVLGDSKGSQVPTDLGTL